MRWLWTFASGAQVLVPLHAGILVATICGLRHANLSDVFDVSLVQNLARLFDIVSILKLNKGKASKARLHLRHSPDLAEGTLEQFCWAGAFYPAYPNCRIHTGHLVISRLALDHHFSGLQRRITSPDNESRNSKPLRATS